MFKTYLGKLIKFFVKLKLKEFINISQHYDDKDSRVSNAVETEPYSGGSFSLSIIVKY